MRQLVLVASEGLAKMKLLEFIAKLTGYKNDNPTANKARIEDYLTSLRVTQKKRSVHSNPGFSIRVSEANTKSFSNVILSLSALGRYDTLPMIICIVRPNRVDFRMANSTFLKRISHSSHKLRVDNVRGSFLGHDIMDIYEGISNRPENFDKLWAIHAEFVWIENLERLVETTNLITATLTRFEPNEQAVGIIIAAPKRAAAAIISDTFKAVERQLIDGMKRNQERLLDTASIDNVNIRGNTIEAIMTGETNAHRLDDIVYSLANGGRLIIDIKTKLLDKASAPKAYNIDKMLKLLAEPGTVFAFFFIGLNVSTRVTTGRLVSMFDPVIIKAMRIQHHWAGRSSRGVTQLTGDTTQIFDSKYEPNVDLEGSKIFLKLLLEK